MIREIKEVRRGDPYLAGLTEFYASVDQLYQAAQQQYMEAPPRIRRDCPRLMRFEDQHRKVARRAVRYARPEIIRFLMDLGNTGLAAGLYSLLRLWA